MVFLQCHASLLMEFFQYSLCRVVLMVGVAEQAAHRVRYFQYSLCRVVLMVSARVRHSPPAGGFQYSLCRVVLMVLSSRFDQLPASHFQYSLCRVVLMVARSFKECDRAGVLSVLALSSRFDGQLDTDLHRNASTSFSTRSVESF